jgi:hypothetical protein
MLIEMFIFRATFTRRSLIVTSSAEQAKYLILISEMKMKDVKVVDSS